MTYPPKLLILYQIQKKIYYKSNTFFPLVQNGGMSFSHTQWNSALVLYELHVILYSFLVLPSALLQGMIFRIEAPKYLNYGALGSIIGHELAHSFIAFINEYYEEAKTTYRDRMQCFADQYDNYFYEDLNFLVFLVKNHYDCIFKKVFFFAVG